MDFVEQLLSRMCHYQHGHINAYLKPMLQRDFISLLPSEYLSLNARHDLLLLLFHSTKNILKNCKYYKRISPNDVISFHKQQAIFFYLNLYSSTPLLQTCK